MLSLKLIIICLEVLLVFNVLILAHELGRFLAARWRGLRVEKVVFGVGQVWGRMKVAQTDFWFGWIPLGVSVSIPQLVQTETDPAKSDAPVSAITRRDKLIVALAGPLFGLVAAAALAAASRTILILFEALLVFNFLIIVHELGHFLAARWRGLKVDRFAIWFGKPVLKTKVRGIEYALGTIPAGGYVALPQMATMEIIEGKTESSGQPLPPISPLDKIIVAFAGPLFSFLLAVGFAVAVWAVGRPVTEDDNSTTVGWVDPDGPAWKAGLRPGDKILEIDNHPVSRFSPTSQDSVTWRIVTSQGTNITIKYQRGGEEHLTQAVPKKRPTQWYERKDLRHIFIMPVQKPVIYDVATNSPAALAGLRKGDEIVAVNGEKIYHFMPIVQEEEAMTNGPIKPITLTVRRGTETFDRTLLAEKPIKPAKSGPSFGITGWQGTTNVTLAHPGPLEQIEASAGQIFATLGTVLSRKSEVGLQQLGGAVMIIRLYTNLFDSENGWRLVLWFSVVLNVNLALLNLLPLPLLDGGHITLGLLEAVRRRPVSGKVLLYVQNAFAVVLIGFMLFIAFYDTSDWVRSTRKNREEPLVFAPKN